MRIAPACYKRSAESLKTLIRRPTALNAGQRPNAHARDLILPTESALNTHEAGQRTPLAKTLRTGRSHANWPTAGGDNFAWRDRRMALV